MRRMTAYLFLCKFSSLFLLFHIRSFTRRALAVCVFTWTVLSVSKCLFFHERKIDSFNSMTSVFGNRITPVAHTVRHSNDSPLMRTMPILLESFLSIDATIYLFIFFYVLIQLYHIAVCIVPLAFDGKTYSMCVRMSITLPAVARFFLFRSHFTSAFSYWQSFQCWMRVNGIQFLRFSSCMCGVLLCAYACEWSIEQNGISVLSLSNKNKNNNGCHTTYTQHIRCTLQWHRRTTFTHVYAAIQCDEPKTKAKKKCRRKSVHIFMQTHTHPQSRTREYVSERTPAKMRISIRRTTHKSAPARSA